MQRNVIDLYDCRRECMRRHRDMHGPWRLIALFASMSYYEYDWLKYSNIYLQRDYDKCL
jgi:hypothetical protein